ncbi:hypothetical protein DSO57_1038329 [Entomophthora muscae]|uniref:Uncharacterized protein n=1 Tax=Entomophthora muscae TaxID=34485 RepID=A0ACC2U8C9_9FUNG|nr:hypothetical protein DSO57_1038329 [Entomophthora muscae]
MNGFRNFPSGTSRVSRFVSFHFTLNQHFFACDFQPSNQLPYASPQVVSMAETITPTPSEHRHRRFDVQGFIQVPIHPDSTEPK